MTTTIKRLLRESEKNIRINSGNIVAAARAQGEVRAYNKVLGLLMKGESDGNNGELPKHNLRGRRVGTKNRNHN